SVSWRGWEVFGLSPVLGCDWLSHYGRLSNNSLTFIRLMGGQLTEQESPVPFPKKLYKRIHNAEVESQLVFIRDSLKLMSRLWLRLYHHDNLPSLNWDTKKIEHFLIVILRQMDSVDTCVSLRADTSTPQNSKLSKYFRKLERSTLHPKGGSTASWELIRRETKLHLDQLDLLFSSIKGRSSAHQTCKRRSCVASTFLS
uniref:Uncharacterized protein n=1 Tax=Mola mola TaxID=94237 RepID=A0A3Q3W021_MOLML